jgi:ABC-type anion transport system duplicated permease subunit
MTSSVIGSLRRSYNKTRHSDADKFFGPTNYPELCKVTHLMMPLHRRRVIMNVVCLSDYVFYLFLIRVISLSFTNVSLFT